MRSLWRCPEDYGIVLRSFSDHSHYSSLFPPSFQLISLSCCGASIPNLLDFYLWLFGNIFKALKGAVWTPVEKCWLRGPFGTGISELGSSIPYLNSVPFPLDFIFTSLLAELRGIYSVLGSFEPRWATFKGSTAEYCFISGTWCVPMPLTLCKLLYILSLGFLICLTQLPWLFGSGLLKGSKVMMQAIVWPSGSADLRSYWPRFVGNVGKCDQTSLSEFPHSHCVSRVLILKVVQTL